MGGCMSQPAVYNKVGPDSSPLPAGVEVLVRSDAEAAAAAEVLTRAFAGTASAKPEVGPGPGRRGGWWVGARPTGGLTNGDGKQQPAFEWCLDAELQDQYADPRRQESMRWVFRFMTELAFALGTSGAVLASRAPSGALDGVCLVKGYHGTPGDGLGTQMTAGCRAGGMPPITKSYNTNPRMVAFEASIASLHKKHAATTPHVQVWAIGVDPGSQNAGVGSKLMEAANIIADREGLPGLLESCSKPFFQRFGYAMLGEEIMRTKAGDEQCSKPLVLMGRGF